MYRAVIYARVSSTGDRQSTERQVADLTRYAETSGMEVVAVFEEKASGAKRKRLKDAILKKSGVRCLRIPTNGSRERILEELGKR